MKTLLIILMFAGVLSAQTFTVEKVSGDVKYQNGSSETWSTLKIGTILKDDAVISTGQNSSVLLKGNKVNFNLNESSAVSVSNIKKMNIDELLLALAMEDMMNPPKEIKKSSSNTAVYGTKEGESNTLQIKTDDFGIKRLNGAVQLAENSLEESAVVAAKETYRKYPDTKNLPSYRIYFANILYDKGLYEEALDEYVDIQKLKLTDEERVEVNEKAESIKMKLLSE
ncbi:MAG: hypothetical protein IH795_00230 [Bacteroidetes bacterium]|nr:hypothetical protein [Bacteroidota bacterium]